MRDVHIWPTNIHTENTQTCQGWTVVFLTLHQCFIPEISTITATGDRFTQVNKTSHSTPHDVLVTRLNSGRNKKQNQKINK